jgi:EmrB/QacA subfamily drug resistance transporter
MLLNQQARISQKVAVGVVYVAAMFMSIMDITIVNTALPTIGRSFGVSPTSVDTISIAYLVSLAIFIPASGWLGDRFGGKRVLLTAIVVFTVASALCGVASSLSELVAFRILQGVGGGMLAPVGMAMLFRAFPPEERVRAASILTIPTVIAPALGPVLGGLLVTELSWRWVFFVNVPIGVVTILLAVRYIAESRVEGVRRSYDLAGAATVTGGLVVIVFAIVKATAWGWGSGRTLGLFAAGLVLLAVFVGIESRSAAPLMRLSIFKVRSLAVGDAALLLVGSAMFGMFYFASLYVQEVLGYSPLKAGLAFLPVTAGIMIGAGLAQPLIKRFGVRNVAASGTTIAALGLLVLTQLPVHGNYVSDLLSGLFPLSIGMGLVFVPLTLMATSGVSADDAGLASGLFNTAQQVGGSLGLAILSTLAASQTSRLLSNHSATKVAATVSGYHVAFFAAALMMFGATVILVVALRKRHLAEVEEAIESGEVTAVAA